MVVNKKDIIRKVASKTLLSQKETGILIDELIESILNELEAGNDVNIVGFGRFFLYAHTPRPVRNPKTQKEMVLQPFKSVKFKSSIKVRNLLKKTHSE